MNCKIFTEEVPFAHLRDGEVVLEVAVRDGRPPRPSEPATSRGLSDDMWSLIQACWDVQPENRPRMSDTLLRIQRTIKHGDKPGPLNHVLPVLESIEDLRKVEESLLNKYLAQPL